MTMTSISIKNQSSIAIVLIVLAVVVVIIGMLLARLPIGFVPGTSIPPGLQGTLRVEPLPLTGFTLVDQHSRAFGLEQLKDKWTFMFFGYTHCPDICPTTMLIMKSIATVLERDPRQINAQFVFVSVDPARDDPASLAGYMNYYNPGFIGLSGTQTQLKELGRQLDIKAVRIQEDTSVSYLMSHTSSIMLIDPRARFYASFSPPHERAGIIERFYASRHYYQQESR